MTLPIEPSPNDVTMGRPTDLGPAQRAYVDGIQSEYNYVRRNKPQRAMTRFLNHETVKYFATFGWTEPMKCVPMTASEPTEVTIEMRGSEAEAARDAVKKGSASAEQVRRDKLVKDVCKHIVARFQANFNKSNSKDKATQDASSKTEILNLIRAVYSAKPSLCHTYKVWAGLKPRPELEAEVDRLLPEVRRERDDPSYGRIGVWNTVAAEMYKSADAEERHEAEVEAKRIFDAKVAAWEDSLAAPGSMDDAVRFMQECQSFLSDLMGFFAESAEGTCEVAGRPRLLYSDIKEEKELLEGIATRIYDQACLISEAKWGVCLSDRSPDKSQDTRDDCDAVVAVGHTSDEKDDGLLVAGCDDKRDRDEDSNTDTVHTPPFEVTESASTDEFALDFGDDGCSAVPGSEEVVPFPVAKALSHDMAPEKSHVGERRGSASSRNGSPSTSRSENGKVRGVVEQDRDYGLGIKDVENVLLDFASPFQGWDPRACFGVTLKNETLHEKARALIKKVIDSGHGDPGLFGKMARLAAWPKFLLDVAARCEGWNMTMGTRTILHELLEAYLEFESTNPPIAANPCEGWVSFASRGGPSAVRPQYLRKSIKGPHYAATWTKLAARDGKESVGEADWDIGVAICGQWLRQQPDARVANRSICMAPGSHMDWSGRMNGGRKGVRLLMIALLNWIDLQSSVKDGSSREDWDRVAADVTLVLRIRAKQVCSKNPSSETESPTDAPVAPAVLQRPAENAPEKSLPKNSIRCGEYVFRANITHYGITSSEYNGGIIKESEFGCTGRMDAKLVAARDPVWLAALWPGEVLVGPELGVNGAE
ncbi:unnamed protein product [Peniophora sp. CBMAI 1063]|nr:unnamed protein product [Peniophora sp. CBMAI 1063]